MNSRNLRWSLAALVLCGGPVWGQEPPAPAAPNADNKTVQADVEFANKLNEYIKTYLSEAPGRAREMQGALKQLMADRAKDLLKTAKLPGKPSVLTAEQLATLNLLVNSYPDTEAARVANDALLAHKRMADEPDAQAKLKEIGIKSVNEALTDDQIKALDDLRTQYPDSEAAKSVNSYLAAQRQREADKVLESLVQDFLKTPGAREALDRLAEKRLEFALSLVEPQQVETLIELIKNFPNTPARKVAEVRLAEARARIARRQRLLKQEVEESRQLRAYWDAIYPSRMFKKSEPFNSPSPTLPPESLPYGAKPAETLPPVPAQ